MLVVLHVSHALRPHPVTLLMNLSDILGIFDTFQLLNQLADCDDRRNLMP
jgi:hypothetical protein